VSVRAREAIEAAGGRVTRTYYNPLGLRAVLLPEWFKKKGRLLPRAVQMVPYNKQWRFDRVGSIPAADTPALEDVPPPEATDGPPPEGPSGGGPPEERLDALKMAATG
jgi:large subunit ribosomal protein L15